MSADSHRKFERAKNLSPHVHTVDGVPPADSARRREQYPAAPADMKERIAYTARRNSAIQAAGPFPDMLARKGKE